MTANPHASPKARPRPGGYLRQVRDGMLPGLDGRPVGDQSQLFSFALAAGWCLLVALPLVVSVLLDNRFHGLPLAAVAIWFIVLRIARWVSPPARCDRLLARGRFAAAAALCERELALKGSEAWRGFRRLAWLNRLTAALLGTGRLSEALVSALEALAERPDPETLANCAQALLMLNRYDEAAGAARLALTLTRERSVSSHAVLATVLLAQGRPAEAQANALTGIADVEALLPFVQPAHHVALLAALCRAERLLGERAAAHTHLAALRKAGEKTAQLRAQVLLEEADAAASAGAIEQALVLLRQATQAAPHLVCWYVTQPYTFDRLRADRRFRQMVREARAEWIRTASTQGHAPDDGAASVAYVAMELAAAQERGSIRPAPHASQRALIVQALTLAGTLALLVWWTWRFFLSGG